MANEQIHNEIHEHLQRLVHKGDALQTGTVMSVDTEAMTAKISLTLDDDKAPTDGVLLNVMLQNVGGFYLIPDANCNCIIGNVDGRARKHLIWAAKYVKLSITIGSQTLVTDNDGWVFNGGNNDGMVLLMPLLNALQTVQKDINKLKNIFNTWAPSPNDGGAALKSALTGATYPTNLLTVTQQNDLENTKIKQ